MEEIAPAVERQGGHGEVDHLILLAHQHRWHPAELPWPRPGAHVFPEVADSACLVSLLPEFNRMSANEREAVKQSELGSHLSTLAYGEDQAVDLAGDTLLLCAEDDKNARWFLGTLLADEAKHYVVLKRYLEDSIAQPVIPHLPLHRVFDQLRGEKDYALNLLVGQVILEGAAASLLASLLIATHEPLLKELLKHISKDEARHMKFAHLAFVHAEELSPPRRRRMEEVLFEAAYAALSSLVAERTWDEFGLPKREARTVTVDALRERGVLPYYSRVVARQLAMRGFPAERVARDMQDRLEQRLRAS